MKQANGYFLFKQPKIICLELVAIKNPFQKFTKRRKIYYMEFYLFAKWNINLPGLSNAKAILLEEQ